MSKTKIAAAIYLGSNSIQLKISENRKGKKHDLDFVEYPLNLGHDTFSRGRITFEKAEKICEIIKNFSKIINDYRVEESCLAATTAVRDADNKEYILDQIYIKTGKKVLVLDDADEKKLISKEMLKRIQTMKKFEDMDALMVNLGTGTVGVSIYEKGIIPFTQNIRMGSLKLSGIMERMQEQFEKSNVVIEEYLVTFANILEKFISLKNLNNFIVTGQEMDLIARICGATEEGELQFIQTASFKAKYEELKNLNSEQVVRLYGFNKEQAEGLLPSMSIYNTLLDFTSANNIIHTPVTLCDALLYSMLFRDEDQKLDRKFSDNTIISAQAVGEKYRYDSNHANTVKEFGLIIFEKTKKIHGLGEKEKLLLQVACLLHDIGKYINTKNHYYHSYFLIKNTDIIGLNSEEIEIAAQIAMYHGKEVPSLRSDTFSRLTTSQRAIVSKLVAIIRMADALDRSHSQKFKSLEVSVQKDGVEIKGSTDKDCGLEQWTFARKSRFFEEVFGIKARLRRKANEY